jgi:tetratricopeptide (TPR) repeat protein
MIQKMRRAHVLPAKPCLRVIVVLILVSFSSTAPALLGQTPPPLPPLSLEDFAPVIREQVKEAYQNARANPRDAIAYGRLGMILQTYEQHEMAAVCYERARSLAPGEFRWAYYLATVQAASGKHAQATATFREAARLRPDDFPAQLGLAASLLASGDLSESRRIYEAALKTHPDSPQAHYGLGRILTEQRDVAAAIEHHRRACDLYQNYGAAHYALGLAYRDTGRMDAAKEHLALYQKNKLNSPPANDPLLNAVRELNVGAAEHLKNGISLEAAGQIDGAIAEHESALKINPLLIEAHANLIILYGRLGQTERAEEHYRAAVGINPHSAESHYNFGVLQNERGKYEEAAQAFLRCLEINPFYAEANHNYGMVLERRGRFDEAAKYYRAALENKPDYHLSHFHLARLLVRDGKLKEAINHFLKTLAPENENTSLYMYALAATYVRAGENERALYYMREARQRAAASSKAELLTLIERDLRTLEKRD